MTRLARLIAGSAALLFLISGCEEIAYVYVEEPPPSIYGNWEADNPEAVGLDDIELAIYSDGTYSFWARIDHYETFEEGSWDYDGYHELCFYSDYINGHHDHESWDIRFWMLDHDEMKVKFEDSYCDCPVYFYKDCP